MTHPVLEHYQGELDWLPRATILLVRHGSRAYGTARPDSDLDVKGVAIPPRRYFTGFLHKFEQAEQKPPLPDLTIYDIRKFFQLAADCNPNIVELLWVDPADILHIDDWGRWLLQHRKDFLSQKAKHTFSGYAVAQLKRIRTHRKWLLDPPKAKPERQDFGLPETTVISADQIGAISALVARGESVSLSENVMGLYAQERAYHNALTQWGQYQIWKKSRNPDSAKLEAQFGFDCKHASHLVRLMRMCREVLTEERVLVRRPDAEELLAIRNGAWEYDQLVEWAERQDVELTELLKSSPLPHSPDRVFLDELCRDMVQSHFSLLDEIPLADPQNS